MSEEYLILGVHCSDRLKQAVEVQRLFTACGCDIQTRVDRHDADGRLGGPGGLILLELLGGEQSCNQLHRAA
jgi:hypothetical protein